VNFEAQLDLVNESDSIYTQLDDMGVEGAIYRESTERSFYNKGPCESGINTSIINYKLHDHRYKTIDNIEDVSIASAVIHRINGHFISPLTYLENNADIGFIIKALYKKGDPMNNLRGSVNKILKQYNQGCPLNPQDLCIVDKIVVNHDIVKSGQAVSNQIIAELSFSLSETLIALEPSPFVDVKCGLKGEELQKKKDKLKNHYAKIGLMEVPKFSDIMVSTGFVLSNHYDENFWTSLALKDVQ
jgi:hypothetical protein